MQHLLRSILLLSLLGFTPILSAKAASPAPTTNSSSTNPCPRYAAGANIVAPADLFSANGVLTVTFLYETRTDSDGNTLFCYMTPEGLQSPTLHVKPGDELMIKLENRLPASMATMMTGMAMSTERPNMQTCGGMSMTAASTNMHFHGTNVSPTCHQDEVIKTLINPDESFQYDIHFPVDEPPGLYWYHPHIHGISEPAVQGGASGAIIVEGLENTNAAVAGLPQRTLVIRDNLVPAAIDPNSKNLPAWDVSLNYSPVAFPAYSPVVIPMKQGSKEVWRVLNASADTIIDLQVLDDGVPRDLQIVGIDGVPTGSQDGDATGKTIVRKHFLLATAARVEFIVNAPARSVARSELITRRVDTGPDGDNDPERPLARLVARNGNQEPVLKFPAVTVGPPARSRFTNLRNVKPAITRKLYFSEVLSDPTNPNSPTNFYVTVDGATPTLFDPNNPPAIVTTQGTVEDWIVENRALENHEFHIHQIHFLVMERDGKEVDGQFRDMINIPFWDGKSAAYPSVKLRMDFRGQYVGDFVYHCHILGHEDGGMMAVIRVLPAR